MYGRRRRRAWNSSLGEGRRSSRARSWRLVRGRGSAAGGSRYSFSLDGGPPLADPRSRGQPDGLTGPSAVVDHTAFPWTDQRWHGSPLAGAVLYELHIGTFSTAGTFAGAIEHLDHLVDLGVTLIEVMPIAEFPGERGWGYDGVLPFAVHHAYGGPDGFKGFVDAPTSGGSACCSTSSTTTSGRRQPPRRVRAVHPGRRRDAVGTGGQPRRGGQRRGPPVHRRQPAPLGARLPRGRAAARRNPRAGRYPAQHILGELGGAALAVGAASGTDRADRRRGRPQRPARHRHV